MQRLLSGRGVLLVTLSILGSPMDRLDASPPLNSAESRAASRVRLAEGSARAPGSIPERRWGHALVYDGNRKQVLLFGGASDRGWLWNGTRWIPLVTPGSAPNPGVGCALAWDSLRRRVVLVGGGNPAVNGTWELDGVRWREVKTRARPPLRSFAALAYDEARKRIVLHGGSDRKRNSLDDTWEYSGTSWRQVRTATTPGKQSSHAMAYDARRRRIVLYGGSSERRFWEYDGKDWVSVPAKPVPDQDHGVALVYSPTDSRLRIAARDELWSWDGTTARRLKTTGTPPDNVYHAAAWDPLRRRLVLFGGGQPRTTNATWEHDGRRWIEVDKGEPAPGD